MELARRARVIDRIAAHPLLDMRGLKHAHRLGRSRTSRRSGGRSRRSSGSATSRDRPRRGGVAYTSTWTLPTIEQYATRRSRRARAVGTDIRIVDEPARARGELVVTLYTVETIKRNVSTWVRGARMSDTCARCSYGARYEHSRRPLRRWPPPLPSGPGNTCGVLGRIVRDAEGQSQGGDVVVTPVTGRTASAWPTTTRHPAPP